MRFFTSYYLIFFGIISFSSLNHLWAAPSWSLIADAKIESVWWPHDYGQNTYQQLQRLELVPTLTARLSENLRFFTKPYLLWDPQNPSKVERLFLDSGEAYLRQLRGSLDFRIGYQILNWGVTDGYNPMDIINPRQYHDPLRPLKLPAPAILLSYGSEHSEQELIYIPKNRESLLPGPQSRWLPREIFIPQSANEDWILLLPQELRYHYESRQTLNRALDHNVGLRLQWHLGAIDLSLIGFEGVAVLPVIQPLVTGTVIQVSPQIVLQTDPDVILRTKNFRHRVGGFSWVSSQADFLFKYATTYSQSLGDDPLLPGWNHESVLALEKNFSFGSNGLLVAVLQHSLVNAQKMDESNLSVNNVFRRAWMFGARLSWQELWSLTGFFLYDSHHHSQIQEFIVARRIQDLWTLELSADFISGKPETALGVYNLNDQLRLSLGRSF